MTGGLAAPLVAAGAGAVLGAGGAAALGSATGIAIMASLFGAAGAGLTGKGNQENDISHLLLRKQTSSIFWFFKPSRLQDEKVRRRHRGI